MPFSELDKPGELEYSGLCVARLESLVSDTFARRESAGLYESSGFEAAAHSQIKDREVNDRCPVRGEMGKPDGSCKRRKR